MEEKIGEVAVDSGRLLISDPCLLTKGKADEIDLLCTTQTRNEEGWLLFAPGIGDGVYPVFAQYANDPFGGNRIAGIRIECYNAKEEGKVTYTVTVSTEQVEHYSQVGYPCSCGLEECGHGRAWAEFSSLESAARTCDTEKVMFYAEKEGKILLICGRTNWRCPLYELQRLRQPHPTPEATFKPIWWADNITELEKYPGPGPNAFKEEYYRIVDVETGKVVSGYGFTGGENK